jgi:DNA-binding MarR family transcriptional regulator
MVLLPYKRMAKVKEREKAILLREQGVSIADIAVQLKVSKSTVSHWCRDIVLSNEALQTVVERSKSKSTLAILRYTEGLRHKRQQAVIHDERKGAKFLGSLSERDIYCIGLGLYWGEGYKHGSQEFGFTNSDSTMIKFYLKWLKTTFDIEKEDLILRVSVNSLHQSRISEIHNFWVQVTGVPFYQFTKPSFLKSKSKKIYSDPEQHFGTLRVKVRRGTSMRREVMGAIKTIGL